MFGLSVYHAQLFNGQCTCNSFKSHFHLICYVWKNISPGSGSFQCQPVLHSVDLMCCSWQCKFVKENKFLAKTMFAYKFRFWEKAALACNSKKDCHTLPPPALDQSGHERKFSLESRERGTQFPFLGVDSIRHPR